MSICSHSVTHIIQYLGLALPAVRVLDQIQSRRIVVVELDKVEDQVAGILRFGLLPLNDLQLLA